MENKKQITAIILAGGKSSRMGSDKGFVMYKNKMFIEHIIDAIQPITNQIIIVSNNPDYTVFKLKRVDDLIKDAGPLAGVYTGLHYSKTENNLIVSCDVPLINTETLKLLTQQINDTYDVIQLESKGKTMPLIAMYKKKCALCFLEILKQGERRLRVALNSCKIKTIVLDKNIEKQTANINTPNDLKKITNDFND